MFQTHFRYILILIVLFLAMIPTVQAQLGMFTAEQRIMLTPDWKGERFPDGRPKVSDTVLQGMKTVSAEEAWGVLRQHKFTNQFAGGWKTINAEPGKRLVGRVVTALFMPLRPDVNSVIHQNAEKEGRVSKGQNSWVIDTLQPDDLLVVDLFGKIEDGTFAGDNLATSIYTKSRTGLIVDGAVRDHTGISDIKGFVGYVRDFHPSAIANVMLMGINVPIRIGGTTVLPGDVVVSDAEGLTFVPAHLAQEVAETAERIHYRDNWARQMMRERKYTPGQIDTKWSPEMDKEFAAWVEEQKKSKKP